MPRLIGFAELGAKLFRIGEQARADHGGAVVVAFQAAYAWWVHENLQAAHPVGRAKFLEANAREKAQEVGRVYADGRRSGLSHLDALLRAGLLLQRYAQQDCPVDTGMLRNSAETYPEGGGG